MSKIEFSDRKNYLTMDTFEFSGGFMQIIILTPIPHHICICVIFFKYKPRDYVQEWASQDEIELFFRSKCEMIAALRHIHVLANLRKYHNFLQKTLSDDHIQSVKAYLVHVYSAVAALYVWNTVLT